LEVSTRRIYEHEGCAKRGKKFRAPRVGERKVSRKFEEKKREGRSFQKGCPPAEERREERNVGEKE